jgi:hypothetical protein
VLRQYPNVPRRYLLRQLPGLRHVLLPKRRNVPPLEEWVLRHASVHRQFAMSRHCALLLTAIRCMSRPDELPMGMHEPNELPECLFADGQRRQGLPMHDGKSVLHRLLCPLQ